MANFKSVAFIVLGAILLLAGIYFAMDLSGASHSDLLDVGEDIGGRSPAKIVIALLIGGGALIVTGLSERMRIIRKKERASEKLMR